jgi:hypothetical protein
VSIRSPSVRARSALAALTRRSGPGAGLVDRCVPVCLRCGGVAAGLFHGCVTFGLGGGDALLSILAGLFDSGFPVGLGLGGTGLGGGQKFAHLLGGGVGVGGERLSLGGSLFGGRGPGFCGGGPLLGGGPDSFHLGLGGGRVGHGGDGLLQLFGDPGDPVGGLSAELGEHPCTVSAGPAQPRRGRWPAGRKAARLRVDLRTAGRLAACRGRLAGRVIRGC